MNKQYTYKVSEVTATPRSKRKTALVDGVAAALSGGSGGSGSGSVGTITGEYVAGEGISIALNVISHGMTTDISSLLLTGDSVLRGVGIDNFGHVTSFESVKLTAILNDIYLRKDIDDTAHGIISFDKSIKSTVFIDGFEGKGWEVTSTGSAIFDSLRVRSDIFLGGKLGSPSYTSGFLGWGVDLDIPTASMELDNMFVRKTFTVHELVYSQAYGLGGSMVTSDSNKIADVEEMDDRYRCYMDSMDGLMMMNLRKGDGIRIQRKTIEGGIKYIFSRCLGITNEYFDVKKPIISGVGSPETGDFAFRWGNDEDVDRQGLIYQTSNDNSAPYIDVYDGITGESTEGCLKVRFGKLTGIRTLQGDLLTGYGAYLNGVYVENSTIITDNGESLDQRFVAMNGRLDSMITGIREDMSSEKGNILKNSSFSSNINYWVTSSVAHFIRVGTDTFLWQNDAFYIEKNKISDIVPDGARFVLRIRSNSITQLNSTLDLEGYVFEISETVDGEEVITPVDLTFSFAFMYKVIRPGTLKVGFTGTPLYQEIYLNETSVYQKFSKVAVWDGKGDFKIEFDGEIRIYGVALFNDALADATLKLWTEIYQDQEQIALRATKEYVDSETGNIYTHFNTQLTLTAEQIAAQATIIDNINNTIATAGWITTADGNTLFASKSLENGNSIVSYINQTATTVTISASKINLKGAVTFSAFDTNFQNAYNATANTASSALSNAATAQNTANSANSAAGTAQSTANTAKSTAETALSNAQSALTNYANLPSWSKQAQMVQAMKDQGLIIGAYMAMSLIDTDSIYANMASIGGFEIQSNSLINNSYSAYISIGSDIRKVNIGKDGTKGVVDIYSASQYDAGLKVVCAGNLSINVGGTWLTTSAYALKTTGSHYLYSPTATGWSSPGVLFAGLFDGGSGLTKYWGITHMNPSLSYIVNDGTNRQRWRVTHNLGHTNYVPQLTSYAYTATTAQSAHQTWPLITAITANYFDFTMKNKDNSAEIAGQPAVISILGMNKEISGMTD